MNKTSFMYKVSNHQSYYSPEVWTKVERELDKQKKRRIFLLFLFSISFMMTFGLGSFYFSQKNKSDHQEIMTNKSKNTETFTKDIPKP